MVAGKKVACEGTGLEELWDELKGGCGAAGRRSWVGREVGVAWCRAGQVSGSSRGRICGGEVGCKPLRRGQEEGARFSWDEGNQALSL